MCAAPSEFEYQSTEKDAGDAPAPRRARKRMIVGRVIGWILVVAALAILVRDIMGWINAGTLVFVAAGELWFALHQNSLMLAEPAISRHIPVIGPWLWHPVISTTLTWPAFLVVGVPGLSSAASDTGRLADTAALVVQQEETPPPADDATRPEPGERLRELFA